MRTRQCSVRDARLCGAECLDLENRFLYSFGEVTSGRWQ